MTLRQKLLLLLSLNILGVVAATAWFVSVRVRHAFEGLDREQTAAIVSQFQRALDQSARDTTAAVDAIAASEDLHNMALNLANGDDGARYFSVASPLAHEERLDFFEIVGQHGSILSSAQWPAQAGIREPAMPAVGRPAALRQEELPYGVSELGIFVVRRVPGVSLPLYVVGGRKIDAGFLRDFSASAGSSVSLYRNLTPDYDARNLIRPEQAGTAGDPYEQLINQARVSGKNADGVVAPTVADGVSATAIPLKGADQPVAAVLVVAHARRGVVELQRQIRNVVFAVAGLGILFAIGASRWLAAGLARPVEELARAAEEVAAGNWQTHVSLGVSHEIARLVRAFNHMTSQLVETRERLLQTERVTAWRELARALADEVETPLNRMTIAVDNLLRAQRLSRAPSDTAYAEHAAILQREMGHLKAIFGSFSELSRCPQAQMETLDARAAVRRVVKLYEPALEKKQIEVATSISSEPLLIMADPDLLHRALSNLMLNAMEAMPEGGSLRVGVGRRGDNARISIADAGPALLPEEAERLFAPCWTGRRERAGMEMAMVQAVVTDHRGTIAAENEEGGGTRFILGLPLAEIEKHA